MTHEQYTLNKCKGAQRTASYRLAQLGIKYAKDALLTPDQISELSQRFECSPAKTTRAKSVPAITATAQPLAIISVPQTQNDLTEIAQPQNESANAKPQNAKGFEAQVLFYAPFAVNIFSIALTVCGLYKFAQNFGVILGVMFSLTLISAVIVSRNNMKGDTSETALKVVLYMEIASCLLHLFTFYSVLPTADILGFDYRAVFAALMAGGAAYLSYNAVKFVRTYNAEI